MVNILIVDDEPAIIKSVKHGLESLDDSYQVIGVISGKECIEFLNRKQFPDLILLDIMMPEMSGWELLNRIKENPSWKDIPLVFLTAKVDEFSKTFGASLTEDYIEKPFDLDELKHRIELVLKRMNKKHMSIE